MKKRLTLVMAVVCCMTLLVGSLAFFTDRHETSATATAGNIDLVFTDVSAAADHKVASQTNTDSQVWTDGKIVNDTNPIMNPGDNFDMGYKLSNAGNKSIDIRQQITLTVTKENGDPMPLTELTTDEGDYQYFMQAAAAHGLELTDASNAGNGVLVYKLKDITLNGTGTGAEVEDGVTVTEQDFDVFMTFERMAKNIFMDSDVTVELDIQAKQHRNTTEADWMLWDSFGTGSGADYEQIA